MLFLAPISHPLLSLNCFSYYQIVVFYSTIAEWTFHSCSASFNIQFFIHLSVSFIVKFSPIVTQKTLRSKNDIHIKDMLQIISSFLLVLISRAAEYLVDVSIKCRIQCWLCPFPLNSSVIKPIPRSQFDYRSKRKFFKPHANKTRITNIPD